jgi:transcriptional antiterminator RfaH
MQEDSILQPAWFCLRSHPKHEHIAAANLRQLPGLEVFNPQLRIRKATRRGPVWMTESLFPNYIFARFILNAGVDQVRYTPGVSTVVRFGDRWPTVPDQDIEELRANFESWEPRIVSAEPQPGDQVDIVDGAFSGFSGVVLRSLPAKQRVQVLLDILGRATTVELTLTSVASEKDIRLGLCANS